MLRRARLLPLLFVTGCFGTEIGNPDNASPGSAPPPPITDLRASPSSLALEATCPGGTQRASVLLTNGAEWDVDATAGGTRGEEAYPSSFEVDRYGSRELVVVIPIPRDASAKASGKVQVHHRREGVRDEPDQLLEIPWSASTSTGGPAATVLCGEEIDCLAADFGQILVGAVWQTPFEVANDGCAPLHLARIETETGEARVVGPALPATVQPGERWRGRLELRPTSAGMQKGAVIVITDDAGRPEQRIGWTANAR
jgi:hypothetical protein